MSPSGRLCLFITVGLILPTRGSTPSKTKSPANPTHGSTPSKTQSPSRDERRESILRQPGSKEDDPFFYDEDTLRKRGLMVAAVLFITGIVILTSGKCRQLPRLCWNRDR
ncbi:FXYD domain-containing ion transport regulator 5 isoform X6 [Odocoileus virginianus]|uniref:FXYD domain-containing ion transport regulator n=1 Tax=Odocoileus virginianus TaxID=9874 RepID=A0ABM4GXB8_ODOVR|nr:FXYD domain-containing ion transport regulator 5 isoform X4 [Odocoileus virginianus texanus]XP_020768314.1 FXYD domain-containing ion transport regulator 5 isoform X4 [Odocoileus virginianus texanus]